MIRSRFPHPARSASPRGPRGGGQALVEFALVAPILFTLLLGVIQLGFLFGGQNALVNSVRETARYASTVRVVSASGAGMQCAGIRTKLTSALNAELPGYQLARLQEGDFSGSPGIAQYSGIANPNGTYAVAVTVSIAYQHPLFIPFIGVIFDAIDGTSDGFFTLRASETMRIENDALTTDIGSVTPCRKV